MRGARGVHDRVVQARLAAAAAQDESEVTTSFGEQGTAMEPAATVHDEHHRGDVNGRQGDVDHSRDPGRIAAAAARAYSRRESMTSATTPEVMIALAFHPARC
ncbi:hypothetical protein [Streptomyces sp. x-19]|uniref:hypothetical protein n=1 Tax=Streptomyces sp. x-19 TaxID=2789280 RepID=UPI00397F0BA7